MKKYSKYLPSKKFTVISSFCLVLVFLIFVIFFMSSSGESFSSGNQKKLPLKVESRTVAELVGEDSDGDSILDWEEALWGTDKNKKMTYGDVLDKIYIENKKKELNIEQAVNETKLTETEKFAREFFASYSAMKTSGEIDDETINNFSSALGQKIVNPILTDTYSLKDVKIESKESDEKKKLYYSKMRDLFKIYQSEGIGNELAIITKGLTSPSQNENYPELLKIADAYRNFSKKIMELSVPESLVEYHLKIANSSNNTGASVLNMAKIVSDPVVGLSGLSQYQKYSEELIKSVTDLEISI